MDFLTKEAEFAFGLYQAAELEVRTTERYVLVALGGIYSYLATKSGEIPLRFRRLAWYSPTFVVIFAGIRALGLGLRQAEVTRWLCMTEHKLSPNAVGWAKFTHDSPWVVTATACAFYLVLAVVTILAAHLMSRIEDEIDGDEYTDT